MGNGFGLGGLLDDLRGARRSLARARGFTAATVLAVAIGIGATTAIYSVVRALVIAPLPFENAKQLVHLRTVDPSGFVFTSTPETVRQWQTETSSFQSVVPFRSRRLRLTGEGTPALVRAAEMAPELLSTLRITPLLGRGFVSDDASEQSALPILLSERMWRVRFGRDPAILGAEIRLDDEPHPVVGVLPAGFAFPDHATDVWLPLPSEALGATGRFSVIARLRDGVSPQAAQVELDLLAGRSDTGAGESAQGRLTEPSAFVDGDARRGALLLFTGVAVLLVILCSNVANLTLARGNGRRHELAVRVATGADRTRLIRHLLLESLCVALVGGLVGIGLANWGLELLLSIRPESLSDLAAVRLDGAVLAFGLAASLVTGIVTGLIPAILLSRPGAEGLVDRIIRMKGRDPGRDRARSGLVVAQTALSVILLVLATLLVRGYERARDFDLGFEPGNLITLRVDLPRDLYTTNERRSEFYETARERLARLPTVSAATYALGIGARPAETPGPLLVDGRDPPAAPDRSVTLNYVAAGFFETLQIPIEAGRTFTPPEERGDRPVTVISAALARRYWGDGDPLGSRVRLDSEQPWSTVVGVAGDLAEGPDQAGTEVMYLPHREFPASARFAMRTSGDPTLLVPLARQRIWELDPGLPLPDAATASELHARTIAAERFTSILMSLFAGLAQFVAGLGLYGVVALLVHEKWREMAIRLALGDTVKGLFGLVFRQGLRLALWGLVLGAAVAAAAARLLGSTIGGVTASDPLAYLAAGTVVFGLAALSIYLPARRIFSTDPLEALRQE